MDRFKQRCDFGTRREKGTFSDHNGPKSNDSWIDLRNAQTLTLALEMINMNPETPLNTPHTNSPCRTGLNGSFDVHYGRVEHLVEVLLKL